MATERRGERPKYNHQGCAVTIGEKLGFEQNTIDATATRKGPSVALRRMCIVVVPVDSNPDP